MNRRPTVDRHGRPLRKLRLSLTDRCNLRCAYCIPEQPEWLPSDRVLRRGEVVELVSAFASCGVTGVRLTGGEPLVRSDLADIVRHLGAVPGITDLSLTTNGVLLADRAAELAAAGLRRINISLDTLRSHCFADLAGRDAHASVVRGVEVAVRQFVQVKLNAVIIRGINDEETPDLVAFARDAGAEVRFIEFMDVTAGWSLDRVVPRDEILARIRARFGPAVPHATGSDPAERFVLGDGTAFGIVPSVSAPFCGACDRTRVSAAGIWYSCLYAPDGVDLRAHLDRGGPDAVATLIASRWRERDDRGAQRRLELRTRGLLPLMLSVPPGGVAMHARGG
jgi:GTP 3',8-cyclase